MKAWDLHCDTLYQLQNAKREGREISFARNSLQIDLQKLKEGNYLLQCFACYVDLEKDREDPLHACMELIDIFYQLLEDNPEDLMQVTSAEDIRRLKSSGKIGAMLTAEEGGICLGDPGILRILYRLGVRMMTLTWNYENELAFPNIVPDHSGEGWQGVPVTDHGLTQKGHAFLEEMERLHMIPDVSHLSDAGTWDVIRCAKRPFAASHSNARSICGHVRNLTDEMIRAMGEKGCLIGLNYCPSFADPYEAPDKACTKIRYLAAHARHIMNLGGEDIVALGSDFDGFIGETQIRDAGQIGHLAQGLKEEGFYEREIEKIFCGNAVRFFEENL